MIWKLELIRRRVNRERSARLQAEAILEQKALELYHANCELRHLNAVLELEAQERRKALSTEQIRLRSLITNLDAAVVLEDENRKIVLVNRRFCKLFGNTASPESLHGYDCSTAAERYKYLFANPDAFAARNAELLVDRKICSDEEIPMADGRVISRTYIPIFSGDKHLGHLWQYRDITHQHRAAEALRHSEEKYRGIIENMELGLLEVDNDDVIVRAYPHFCEMVGYEEPELVGKLANEVFLVPEFASILTQQEQQRVKGKAGVYEMQIFNKKRERVWVLISGAPIFGPEERKMGTLGIHYDITKQKNLVRELEEARYTAEAAQEAEKQFLANMSHEIRTPLNAIIGMSHLLYDTQPTQEQTEYLDILRHSSEMLRALITDVLDFSKIRAGHLELQEKEYDLVSLVRSMIKSTQLRHEDRPVRIVSHIDPTIKNLIIGDDLLLHQVLNNLIGNAEKFTAKGKILVSVHIAQCDGQTPPMLEIRVADSGIGIPADKYELIFQSFRQVDGDIKRKFGGTGLGLSITRQIVELQGGTIRVESELGKGSTFIVQLPYRDSGIPIAAQDKPELVFRPLESSGKQLLVVEDNHMNRKYIGALLRKWGMAHTFAHNGLEGLKLAREKKFDLILMDIQMPEMDGYESTISIRQSAELNKKTPIIALTASAMISQKDKAFRAGMDDYLSKPFKPGQLFEKIGLFCGEAIKTETQVEAAPGPDIFQFNARLDAVALQDVYGGDLLYAAEMFETFLQHVLPELDQLHPLLAAGNLVDFARLAHKLKPTFGIVGLSDLEKVLEQLETAAKAENLPCPAWKAPCKRFSWPFRQPFAPSNPIWKNLKCNPFDAHFYLIF